MKNTMTVKISEQITGCYLIWFDHKEFKYHAQITVSGNGDYMLPKFGFMQELKSFSIVTQNNKIKAIFSFSGADNVTIKIHDNKIEIDTERVSGDIINKSFELKDLQAEIDIKY